MGNIELKNAEFCSIAGISGDAPGGTIKKSKNLGKITSVSCTSSAYCAGIAGWTWADLIDCINYGDIYAESCEPWIGGMTGDFNGEIMQECYNSGKITVISIPDDSGYSCPFVGGVAGGIYSGDISNCYNMGNIEIIDSKIEGVRLGAYVRRILWRSFS